MTKFLNELDPKKSESVIKVAMDGLGISEEDALTYSKPVPEISGWYFWSPTRGGKAMLVDSTGETLTAPSSISFDKHVAEFKAGKRN